MTAYAYQPQNDYPLTRHPGKWTTQRNIRLISYARDGRPVKYIAKKLGFTPAEILKRILCFSIDYRPKRETVVTTTICTHKARAQRRKILSSKPTRPIPVTRKANGMADWSEYHDAKILRLAKLGQTGEQIAKSLGGVDAAEVSLRKIALSMTGGF